MDSRALEPGFWNDQRAAQKVVREAQGLRDEIELWTGMEKRVADLEELAMLLDDTPDEDTDTEVQRELETLAADFARERTLLLFSGD